MLWSGFVRRALILIERVIGSVSGTPAKINLSSVHEASTQGLIAVFIVDSASPHSLFLGLSAPIGMSITPFAVPGALSMRRLRAQSCSLVPQDPRTWVNIIPRRPCILFQHSSR